MNRKLDFGQINSYISKMNYLKGQKLLETEPVGSNHWYEGQFLVGEYLDNIVAGKIKEEDIGKFKRS